MQYSACLPGIPIIVELCKTANTRSQLSVLETSDLCNEMWSVQYYQGDYIKRAWIKTLTEHQLCLQKPVVEECNSQIPSYLALQQLLLLTQWRATNDKKGNEKVSKWALSV